MSELRTDRHLPGLFVPFCVMTLLVAGCAVPPPAGSESQPQRAPAPQAAPPVNLSGYSASFKQGYTDGCASARGSTRRDETRYKGDADYMMGWTDGHSICRRR